MIIIYDNYICIMKHQFATVAMYLFHRCISTCLFLFHDLPGLIGVPKWMVNDKKKQTSVVPQALNFDPMPYPFTSICSVRNCVRTLQLDQTLFTQITKMNQRGHKEIESGVCPGVCKISSDSSSIGSSSFKYILAPSSSQS